MSVKHVCAAALLMAAAGCIVPVYDVSEPGASQPADSAAEPAGATQYVPSARIDAEPARSQRVPAQVGVGKKGRSLDEVDGVGNVVAQPAKSLFAAKERIVFEIQIPQALQLYKATNGSPPKSHEEFMDKIIKANNIRLPQLAAGSKYVYDPDVGELMVERPQP